MDYIIMILRWVILIVVAALFLGIIIIFVMMASEGEDRKYSVKVFFLNIISCLVDLGKLVASGAFLFVLVWCCSFITQPPCVNSVKQTDEGCLLSDTSMVCDSNDSTMCYTVKRLSQNDTPGRFTRCIRCGRIYKLHDRWLNEEERRLKQINDDIAMEIAIGLLVDP